MENFSASIPEERTLTALITYTDTKENNVDYSL